MMQGARPRTAALKAVPRASEVRFRSKGTNEAFRNATILCGPDASDQARILARKFASTYGDLEFAVFKDGALLEKVA